MTDDADVRMASSVVDYIFRRLALDYLPFESRSALGIHTAEDALKALLAGADVVHQHAAGDAAPGRAHLGVSLRAADDPAGTVDRA